MEDNFNHSSFSFIPSKLRMEREKLRKKYGDGEVLIPDEIKSYVLSRLLNKIKKLTNDDEEIKKFALSLKKMDIRILLYDFPFANEHEEVNKKILKMFRFNYFTEIGTNFWFRLQNDYMNQDILHFLRYAFETESDTFLNLDSEKRYQLNRCISINFFDNIVSISKRSEKSLGNTLSALKIDIEKPLGRDIIKKVLLQSISNDDVIDKNGIPFIVQWMSKYFDVEYQQFCKTYILNRSFDKLHLEIIKHMLVRIGDPRSGKVSWNFLDEGSIQKVIKFLNLIDMRTFFDQDGNNERFNYWKKYFDNKMNDFDLIKTANILTMDFGNFVVVEFGSIGAAYFYHKEGYEKVMKPLKKQGLSKTNLISSYKNTSQYEKGCRLYIKKLIHYRNNDRSYWQSPFDDYMSNYLKGNFNFEHLNYK